MKVAIDADAARVVAQAVDRVEELVRRRPDAVLGIATGSSPEPLYAELAARAAHGLDLSQLRITCLDEYVGLAPDNPQSYRHYITEHVLDPWGVDPTTSVLPEVTGDNPDEAAADFERRIIALGGVDLQILGVGLNGHIGFNEPGSALDSRTRVVGLTESTREANSRFFASKDDVPTHAVTQGIGTIMEAKQTIMLAFGEAKASAVQAMLSGPVSADVPASVLQQHAAVDVFLDEAAASRVNAADFSQAG